MGGVFAELMALVPDLAKPYGFSVKQWISVLMALRRRRPKKRVFRDEIAMENGVLGFKTLKIGAARHSDLMALAGCMRPMAHNIDHSFHIPALLGR